jgi:hypothetical protein
MLDTPLFRTPVAGPSKFHLIAVSAMLNADNEHYFQSRLFFHMLPSSTHIQRPFCS